MSASIEMNPNRPGSAAPHVPRGPQNSSSKSSGLRGHVVSWISAGSAQLNKLFSDMDALGHLMQAGFYSIQAVSYFRCGQNLGCLTSVAGTIERSNGYIDATRAPADLQYFTDAEFKSDYRKGASLKIAAVSMLTVADVVGAALFLKEVGVISLAKVSEQVGRIPVLGQSGLGLVDVCRGFAVAGLVLTAFDVARKIGQAQVLKGNIDFSDRQLWVKLAAITASIALKVFIIAGGLNPLATISLGLLAAGLGLWADFQPKPKLPKGVTTIDVVVA